MNARLALWRVMAWIGVRKWGSSAAEGEGSGGWQDKTGAVGVGGDAWFSNISSASQANLRRSAIPDNDAFQPFFERLRSN